MADKKKTKYGGPDLGGLFGLSRDAVVGVRANRVVFMNPAAVELFGTMAVGLPAGGLLPAALLESELESFVCLAELSVGTRRVSAVRQDGLLLLTVPREEPPMPLIPAAILNQLRTAAYNLRLSADGIITRTKADETLGDYTSALYHSYYSLLRLTDDLADASALSAGQLSCHLGSGDLAMLCRELAEGVSFFTESLGARVLWRGGEAPCPALLDAGRIRQMLLGLMAGALQRGAKTLRLGLARQGRMLFLSLDDDGEAIPEERLSCAFSLWSRQDLSGVPDCGEDLCLYIAQGIARLHGGVMLLQSRPERGTRVRVALPASDSYTLRDRAATVSSEQLLKALSSVLSRGAYQKRLMD